MTLVEAIAEIITEVKRAELAAELIATRLRASVVAELQAERERLAARERKARQRDRKRDIAEPERDTGVTSTVTSAGQSVTSHTVPPDPPSGSSLTLFSSPESSKPDQEDPHSDEPRYSAGFVQFWMEYPSKVAKGAAWSAWKKSKPPLHKIMLALSWQRNTKKWRDGFVPHPATYINDKRWLDEPEQRRDIGVTATVTYQDSGKYLEERDRCEFHRETGQGEMPAPTPVSWCRRCQRLQRAATGGGK